MRLILLIISAAGLLPARAPLAAEFEVASIKPMPPGGNESVSIGLHLDGSQVRIVSLPLRDYIARAWRVKIYQITGPDWITSEKFDLSAKLPAGSNSDQIPEMLQSLLVHRFQMKLHHEKKELPVYALVPGRPPLKIRESAPDDAAAAAQPNGVVDTAVSGSAAGVSVNLGNGSSYTFANGKFTATKLSMDMLARQIERYMDRPVVDMTGIKGNYDLTLNVTPEDAQAMLIHAAAGAGVSLPPQVLRLADGASIPSLLESFEQLGLKLDARRAPLDVLVIDQASKTPTEN